MSTKLESYLSIIPEREIKKRVILESIKECSPVTRYQLSVLTGYRLSTVCGRVNELLKDNFIKVSGSARDVQTNKIVETLTINI